MAELIKFEDNNKIGYKDENGNIIIEPIYSSGQLYFGKDTSRGEYASVAKGELCGIINEEGKIIIPFEYEEVFHLFDNLFAARKKSDSGRDWYFGVIDIEGNLIIPFSYKYISYLGKLIKCCKKANCVNTDDFITLDKLDDKGQIYEYRNLNDIEWLNSDGCLIYNGNIIKTENEMFITQENDKYGVININGEVVLPTKYNDIHCTRKDRFVVRLNDEDNWSFGVVDNNEQIIIDFKYKYISWETASFYECYRNCNYERDKKWHTDRYFDKNDPVWFNSNGEKICENMAKILSENSLAVESDGKWGVYNQSNKRIINFIYDDVDSIHNRIIVSKDGYVGILDDEGRIIITPSYQTIECVYTDDNEYTIRIEDGSYISIHGIYSKKFPFDSTEDIKIIQGKTITYNLTYKGRGHDKGFDYSVKKEYYKFDKFFILINADYSEIFSEEIGILSNSRFEIIRPLTNIYFAVRDNMKWGVYKADESKLIIKCEYERIKFEGKNVVLLNNDGFWGAKTLVNPSYPLFSEEFDVDIPIKFLEIEILDDFEQLYGVRTEKMSYNDFGDLEKVGEKYTIVDKKGKDYFENSDNIILDKQCQVIDSNVDRILASRDNKYGFISLDGYISIPFQYDEVLLRKDGKLDVRIENRWGVIDIIGKEIVNIKYSERLPSKFENLIAKNSTTGRYGVLSDDGSEKIPSIYEHLLLKKTELSNLFFFGYNGYEDDCEDGDCNFFSGKIQSAIWGCLKENGESLINAKYDCFKIQDGFILGGRNGSMLAEGQHRHTYFESEYSGVYDLFTFSGQLILGGFSSFFYNKERCLFCFQFGGEWEQKKATHDEWGNSIYYYSYHFDDRNSRWLVLNQDLLSIMRNNYDEREQFPKGFKVTITPKKEDDITINHRNVHWELFTIKKPSFKYNLMVCGNKTEEWVVRISDGLASKKYNNIRVIEKDCFFYTGLNGEIGISKLNTIDGECEELSLLGTQNENVCVITYPISGYIFVVFALENEKCEVKLYNINNPNDNPIVAIKSIEKNNLMDNFSKGYLLLTVVKEIEGLPGIVLPKLDIFDEDFKSLVSSEETEKTYIPFEKTYWYTNDKYLFDTSDSSNQDDNHYNEDNDYDSGTWDAMTDGMHGDYSGGDVDYDGLGF